ncbi:MAG: flavin monoamine oxidase family protein [Pseudonocardiaceae bacterium]
MVNGSVERGAKKVTVVGAGISGLIAAYELEQLGNDIEVFEGSSRIGGRICTHRFGSGEFAPSVELGAMRIPAKHCYTMAYVEKLGLIDRLGDFRTLFSEEGAYHTTSAGFVRVRDAAQKLVHEFCLGLNGTRYSDDVLLFGAWLTAIGNAIAPANFRVTLRNDISVELLKLVEKVDLKPFLRGDRQDRFDLHAFFAAHPAIRSSGSGRLNGFLDDILNETSPELARLEGGMDQLVYRLKDSIRGPILCNQEVLSLDVQDDHVLVELRQGTGTVVRRCDYVLCTIPFSILRNLRLNGLSSSKRAVINEVSYWSATKVAFLCREPFWERDGITGGASFSGGRVRQTYYPPVEADPARGAVLLASYTMGDDADVLGGLPEVQRHEVVLDEVARMHPELLQPGMVIDIVSQAWGQYRWSRGGGVTRWGKDAMACGLERDGAARPEGRLFFAGEHCSSTTAWIDGAIESAVNAVHKISRTQPSRCTVSVGRAGAV